MTVAGKADVRLLPTPVLTFTDVRVGDPDTPPLVIERFRAQVELTPLLKGEINVLEMVVERPTFSLDLADLAGTRSGGEALNPIDPRRVSLDQVEIVQGEALIIDSRAGRQWPVSDINAHIEARSLHGPARLDGGLRINGEPLTVRAAAGRFESGALPLKVSLAPANLPVTMSLDGSLELPADGEVRYGGAFSAGAFAPLQSAEEQATGPPSPALRAEGEFELSPDSLKLDEMSLAYGPPERPIQAVAQARLDIGPRPRFDLALDARQIDVDRAFGGGPEDPVSIERATALLLDSLDRLPVPEIPGSVRLNANGVVVGGGVIQGLGAELTPQPGGWRIDRLSAELPGETRADLSGELSLGKIPAFDGHARLQSPRPAAFAAWWQGTAGEAAGLDAFDVEADLSLRPDTQTADEIVLALDGGTITGEVAVQTFDSSDETYVSIALAADRLNIDKARDLAGLVGGRDIAEGEVDRIALDLRAETLVAGNIEADGVALQGELQEDWFDLRKLAVADLAGATVEARGRINDPLGQPTGRLDASVAAESLAGTAEFLGSLFPGSESVGRFAEVAPSLAPVDATLSFSAGNGDHPLSLDVAGTFGGTQVSVTAAGQGSLLRPASLAGNLDALIVADDTAVLLSQLGLEVIPLPDTGPARIELAVAGELEEGAEVNLEGEAAGARLSLAGEARLAEGRLRGGGELELASDDIDPLLLLAGVALPGIGEGHALTARGPVALDGDGLSLTLSSASFDGMPVRGELALEFGETVQASGRLQTKAVSLPLLFSAAAGYVPEQQDAAWPDASFNAALPDWIALDLALAAGEVDIGLGTPVRNGSFGFAFKDGTVSIDGLEGTFAGGNLAGNGQLGLADGEASFELSAALDGAALGDLAWHRGGRPVLRGLLDTSFEVSGRGRSVAGLVSTLSGSGSFVIRDGLVRSVNPHAFDSIMRAADAGLELKAEAVEAAFRGHLDAGTLMFDRASGSFSVTSGIVRISTVSVDAPSATVLGAAVIDLNDLTLRSDWSLKVDAGEEEVIGAQPEVGLAFAGPIADPGRSLDVAPLLGFLTVRAFEQEVERIETLQADILEKEFFLRQLRRQREEQARREREAEEAEEAERLAREAAEETDAGGQPPPSSSIPAAGEPPGGQSADADEAAGAQETQDSRLPPLQSLSVGEVPIFGDGEPLRLLPDNPPPPGG